MKIDLNYVNSKLPPELGPIQIDNIVNLEFRVKNDKYQSIEENDVSIFYSWNNPKMEQRGMTYIVRIKDGEPKEFYRHDFKNLRRLFNDNILKHRFFSKDKMEIKNHMKTMPYIDGFVVNDILYKRNYNSVDISSMKDEDAYFYRTVFRNNFVYMLDDKWYNDTTMSEIFRYKLDSSGGGQLNKVYLLERYETVSNRGNLFKFEKLAKLNPSVVFYYFDNTDDFKEPQEFLIELADENSFNDWVKHFFGVDSLPLVDYTRETQKRLAINEDIIMRKSAAIGQLFLRDFSEAGSLSNIVQKDVTDNPNYVNIKIVD